MLPRVRLTSDGRLRVKVPRRKSKLYEVPFLDRYRRRAFRNLRYVLNELDLKIVGEEVVNRNVNVPFEGNPIKVEVKDTVLSTNFAPTPELVKDHPALNKPAYPITFIYDGKGMFKVAFGYDEEQSEAFREFLDRMINQPYLYAYLKDAALKKETELEREVVPDIRGEIQAEGLKPSATQVEAQAEKPRTLKEKRGRTQLKSAIKPQIDLSIEEVKTRIGNYNPTTFRDCLALERYHEALAESPDKEEEIHRNFYSLINGEKDLKDFYYQLYSLAPKLIERLQLP